MIRFTIRVAAIAAGVGCFAGLALGIGFAGVLVVAACQ